MTDDKKGDGENMGGCCTYAVDQDGVAVVTVDNPPMNVLSEQTVNAITYTMLQATVDPRVRVIILTGKGKAFIAGADIKEFQQIKTHAQVQAFCDRGHGMADAIEGSDKPVICAINGFCLGGGLEVALACHLRIAAETARLGLPEINLGIIPGFGGTQRLPRVVGKAKGLELILTGGHMSAQEALALGIVGKVVPAENLLAEAGSLARTIAQKGRVAVRAAMHAVSDGLETTLANGCAIEIEHFRRVKVSADAVEGVDAFLTKRVPQFKDM